MSSSTLFQHSAIKTNLPNLKTTRIFSSFLGKADETKLTIVKYPHPSLRAKNFDVTVEELENGSISKIAKDMLHTMYEADGVGLAAPQIGINKRLMVYNDSGDPNQFSREVVLVNPTITKYSEATDVFEEGCLSIPKFEGYVERSTTINITAKTILGDPVKKNLSGWEARVFQHEYDHLDGILFIDKLQEGDLQKVKPILDRLKDEF
mmetsp:Transcript_10650/g.16308  ORF Transcript_10650/g.16308 Transcript_10650/m.16308 type:complete len:207 (+) Transcript_10650:37-657(+)